MSLDSNLHRPSLAARSVPARGTALRSGSRAFARCSGALSGCRARAFCCRTATDGRAALSIATLAVAALVLAAGAAGCVDPVDDRSSASRAAAGNRVGDDDRLEITVRPGRIDGAERVETGLTAVDARASGPYPVIRISNGTLVEQRVELTLEGSSPRWEFRSQIEPLPIDARQDGLCLTSAATSASTLLAPATVVARPPAAVEMTLRVPRCARLTLRAGPPRETQSVRFAVIGSVAGDPDYLRRAIEAARALDVQYTQLLGDLAFSDDRRPFGELLKQLEALNGPWGAAIGPRDTARRSSDFIDTFGQTDFVTSVGEVRYVVFDTASARVGDAQLALIEGLPPRRVPGVAFTSTPPLTMGASQGLRSSHQGQRLIELLAERGVHHVLAAQGPQPERRQFGPVDVLDVAGGGGRRREASIALVTILRPWPALDSCTTSVDCAGVDRCDHGFCRTPCDEDDACDEGWHCLDDGLCAMSCDGDDDCPLPLPECRAGSCDLDPRIDVELIAL